MGKKHRQSKLTARKKAFKSEKGSKASPHSGKGKKLGVGKLGVSKQAQTPKNKKREKVGGHVRPGGEDTDDDLTSSDEERETTTNQKMTPETRLAAHILYEVDHRILLVGDGDFSFARALTVVLGSGANLVATAFDSRDLLLEKYNDAGAVILEVERQGAKVLYDIDATNLSQCLHVGKKRGKGVADRPFDRIVFNFPHVGLGIKDEAVNIQHNAALLLHFFHSASPLLATHGQIHVTLKRGKPYDQWGLLSSAHSTGKLKALGSKPFRPAAYPMYAHRRTLGYVEGVSAAGNEEIEGKARTFIFQNTE